MEIVRQPNNEKKTRKKKMNINEKTTSNGERFEWAWPDRLLYGFEESMYHNNNGSIRPGYLGPFGVLNRRTKRYMATEIPYKLQDGKSQPLTVSLYKDAKEYRGFKRNKSWACPWTRGTPEFGVLSSQTKSYYRLALNWYDARNDEGRRPKW
jgi:hypothetical protein